MPWGYPMLPHILGDRGRSSLSVPDVVMLNLGAKMHFRLGGWGDIGNRCLSAVDYRRLCADVSS